MPDWLSLSPRRLAAVLMVVALFVLATRPLADTDLWWHLATGRLIAAEGTIPHADPFSYTVQGAPWIAHEWLSDVLLFGLYGIGGESALVLFTSAVVSLTFAVMYRLCPARPHLAVPLTFLASLCTMVVWGPRPQVLTMLCASLTLVLLSLASGGQRRALWLLPPLMLLWANLHSGFLLGLAMLTAALVGEVLDRVLRSTPMSGTGHATPLVGALALTTGLSLSASLVNPNGVQLLLYPYFTLTSKAMQTYILEWHSPDFHDIRFLPFAAFLLLMIAATALASRRPSMGELLMVLGLGYAALVSVRNIPLFVIAATPLVAGQLESALENYGVRIPGERPAPRGVVIVNWIALLAVAATLSVQVAAVVRASDDLQETFPVRVADYINADTSAGSMLNSYNLGGYLIWRLFPGRRVFIDGRADVYGDTFMDEYYARIWRANGDWRGYLNRYGIQLVVLERDAVLSGLLRSDGDWAPVFSDDVAIVFKRRQP